MLYKPFRGLNIESFLVVVPAKVNRDIEDAIFKQFIVSWERVAALGASYFDANSLLKCTVKITDVYVEDASTGLTILRKSSRYS